MIKTATDLATADLITVATIAATVVKTEEGARTTTSMPKHGVGTTATPTTRANATTAQTQETD